MSTPRETPAAVLVLDEFLGLYQRLIDARAGGTQREREGFFPMDPCGPDLEAIRRLLPELVRILDTAQRALDAAEQGTLLLRDAPILGGRVHPAISSRPWSTGTTSNTT
jgi:hypothetical protein